MSGKVKPSTKLRAFIREELERAGKLYADFSGHDPESVQEVDISVPKAGIIVGRLDGILYTTVRDNEDEAYIHEFRPDSAPLLVASADGEALFIVDGAYSFTDRGIEDR